MLSGYYHIMITLLQSYLSVNLYAIASREMIQYTNVSYQYRNTHDRQDGLVNLTTLSLLWDFLYQTNNIFILAYTYWCSLTYHCHQTGVTRSQISVRQSSKEAPNLSLSSQGMWRNLWCIYAFWELIYNFQQTRTSKSQINVRQSGALIFHLTHKECGEIHDAYMYLGNWKLFTWVIYPTTTLKLEHGWVITSHKNPWDGIMYPCFVLD